MTSRTLCAFIFAAAVPFAAQAAPITGETGGGQSFDNMQPSLVLQEVISLSGIFPLPGQSDLSSVIGLGSVRMFAGDSNIATPFGAPAARGQTLSIVQNTALFSLLGTTYGGNGITTFALPDLAGRVAVHAGSGPVLRGEQSGVQNQTLTQAQLPAHAHTLPGAAGLTGITGGNQPFDNRQPSLGLNYIIATDPAHSPATTNTYLGQVGLFAGSFAPTGFQFAEGQLLNIAGNTSLFSLIGTTYGGDGVTTFALPDLRGRTAIGAGQAPGLSNYDLGATGGASSTTLTTAQLPSHSHTLPPSADVTGASGGGQPVDNMQPYLALHYMIALEGVFPSLFGSGILPPEDFMLGEIVLFAGNVAPQGFAFAEGQILLIEDYETLFFVFGNAYGGDGITTFALPDLRGRAVIGAGGEWEPGEKVGSEQFVLSVNQMPPHTHTLADAAPIPEPATLTLLGAGIAGLGLARRRKKG